MNRVWEIQELKGGRLLIMLAIADHANEEGEAWPSQKSLASKARLDPRQVRRVEESLCKDNYLTVEDRPLNGKVRRVYQLFPKDEDKMSADKKSYNEKNEDKMSAQKAVKKSAGKRTYSLGSGHFGTAQADISDENYSHARSEPPIEPSEESSVNQIVPPIGEDDLWAKALSELIPSLPMLAGKFLASSRLESDGVVQRILLAPDAANGQSWLQAQASPAIARKLRSILGRDVRVEIVAAEPVAELEPAV